MWMKTAWLASCGVYIIALISSKPALAQDKPVIAPVPNWVTQIALPLDSGSDDDSGPVKTLLRDEQIDFSDGAITNYMHLAVTARTPDGLARVGNVSLTWNPDTERMTIHSVRLLRRGRATDLLANGSGFIVLHREKNLEQAMLDGTLTATYQIPDLRVGDVVELGYSRRHADPLLKGHRAFTIGFAAHVNKTAIRARWPTDAPVSWSSTSDLSAPTVSRNANMETLSAEFGELPPPKIPKGAPPRYASSYHLSFSDFSDWSEVGALMAPLYVHASTVRPTGVVAREAARIAAQTPDPFRRAEAALMLVQDQVRYLYVGMNDGGFLPADAETTWSRRFGDCKAKTALLLALLGKLGIKAEPVAVNIGQSADAIGTALPNPGLFNHVLVRATVGGHSYWLDGARSGDRRLADLPVPTYHWGLPLISTGSKLMPLMPAPLTRPTLDIKLHYDASNGFVEPVPLHATAIFAGDEALAVRRQVNGRVDEGRSDYLKEWWAKAIGVTDLSTVEASYDEGSGRETFAATGRQRLEWNDGRLEASQLRFGSDIDLSRSTGPNANAPYSVPYPFAHTLEETIALPDGGKGFEVGKIAFNQVLGGMHIIRSAAIVAGELEARISWTAIAPEFAVEEAPRYQATMRQHAGEHVVVATRSPESTLITPTSRPETANLASNAEATGR